ncbi:MAG: hypothetical protein QNJ85_09220 [Gammaproteobacteria bacterium]|nr:hypothetical protein [Gammaproteobacteria bacterium]
MAVYRCKVRGMNLGPMTRGSGSKGIVQGIVTPDDGREVALAQYPGSHGRITSPICCGRDMHRTD